MSLRASDQSATPVSLHWVRTSSAKSLGTGPRGQGCSPRREKVHPCPEPAPSCQPSQACGGQPLLPGPSEETPRARALRGTHCVPHVTSLSPDGCPGKSRCQGHCRGGHQSSDSAVSCQGPAASWRQRHPHTGLQRDMSPNMSPSDPRSGHPVLGAV